MAMRRHLPVRTVYVLVEWGLACCALIFSSGCVTPSGREEPQFSIEEFTDWGHQVYFLRFNSNALLAKTSEYWSCMRALRTKECHRDVVIVALGWGLNEENYYSRYLNFIGSYLSSGNARNDSPKTFVCVAWDGDLAGFAATFGDLLPTKIVGQGIGSLLDNVFFTVSFWSKAYLADRIGWESLPEALDALLPDDGGCERRIFMIGHSFGGRIVSGITERALQRKSVAANHGGRIAAAWPYGICSSVLLMPAISPSVLGVDPDYPVVVVQSDFDHANKALYPLANVIFNSGFSKAWDREGDNPIMSDLGLGFAAAAASVIILPWDYLGTQLSSARSPARWVGDTLDSLPILEIPIRALRAERRSWTKGLLQAGSTSESIAVGLHGPINTMESIPGTSGVRQGKRFIVTAAAEVPPLQNGLMLLDCSAAVYSGKFLWWPYDMRRNWHEWCLGWLDPVGAHSNICNELVFCIIDSALGVKRQQDHASASLIPQIFNILPDILKHVALLPTRTFCTRSDEFSSPGSDSGAGHGEPPQRRGRCLAASGQEVEFR